VRISLNIKGQGYKDIADYGSHYADEGGPLLKNFTGVTRRMCSYGRGDGSSRG
jgi:hypothetical protein